MSAATLERLVDLKEASIVIVDDQAPNVDVLERFLRAAGVGHVRGFTDPVMALVGCAELEPDLVLLDLHMPRLDGLQFLEQLQCQLGEEDLLPVMMLTADITAEARHSALLAGAQDFLTKPFDRTDVVLRVRNLLQTRALWSSLRQRNDALATELRLREAAEVAAEQDRAMRHRVVTGALRSDALSTVFQPFVDLHDGSVVGVESLARFDCPPPWTPDRWFAEAASVGLGTELELAAVATGLQCLDLLPDGAFMSVNVAPSTVTSAGLAELLETVPADRVVLELTEHAQVHDYDELTAALSALRARGVRLAIDDTGAGFTSLQHILALEPDIVKLDIALTRGIDTDPARRSLAAALVRFADEIGALLIAEGIETAAEAATLVELGVRVGQGYHLGRPGRL